MEEELFKKIHYSTSNHTKKFYQIRLTRNKAEILAELTPRSIKSCFNRQKKDNLTKILQRQGRVWDPKKFLDP
jgi:hypothetical protein